MNNDDSPAEIAALGTIVGIWAHPADEAFSAGLLGLARDLGQRVVVVTATRGETGTSDPECWPPERMSRLRSDELASSLAVLGVEEHRQLGYPDGRCADVGEEAAVVALSRLVDEIAPDTLVTFGPDGMTGHPDHQAVSRWVCAAWEARRRSARLLYSTSTPSFAVRFEELNRRLFEPGFPVTTETDDLALSLQLSDRALDRKLGAIRAHVSQLSALRHSVEPAEFSSWWAEEAYTTP